MFKIEEIQYAANLPNPSQIVKAVRYWDKAGTEGGGAYTAGVLMFRLRNKKYFVADIVRGQWSSGKRESIIRQSGLLDKALYDRSTGDPGWLARHYTIWTEQEPGSGGKESAENTVRNLAGFQVKVDRVTGDKVFRAEGYATQMEHGNIIVLGADWTREFVREHEKAPVGKYKDQWDAASGAFNKLAAMSEIGVW